MHPASRRRHTRTRRSAAAAAAAVLGTLLVWAPSASPAGAAPATGRDGRTPATAGASCWGIRQEFPASPDGSYWVVTPTLGEPAQVHCDMTTDGGGWVLVGRGREGWTFARDGQNAAQVRTAVTGPSAFVPAALGSDTVDGLLDGGRTSDLPDGVRVRRATSTAGTSWQEVRLKVLDQGPWSWAFGGGILLSSTTVDGTTQPWGNTRDTGLAWGGLPANGFTGVNDLRRMLTYPLSSHGGKAGFSFGGTVAGSTSATSHLWVQGTEKNAVAFAQVWLRPRLANDAPVPAVPAGGLPAEPRPWAPKQRPERAPWGVVGLDHTGEASADPWGAPVLVVKVAGERVYVGGRFTGVVQGPTGTPVAQPFLAAFDRRSGAWIDSFRPRLDGRVWDLAVTPSGALVVAGDFLSVNGSPSTTALAMVDGATGATVTSWRASLRRESATGERAVARSLALGPDAVYVGGRFTHLTGGTWNEVRVTNAAKVRLAGGSPLQAWAPSVPATTARMALSPRGDRIHLAGYFDRVNGSTAAGYFATLDATTGAVVAGQGALQPSAPTGKKYQLAVAEVGETVVVGGAEHNLHQYRRPDRTLAASHVTLSGGDTQAVAVVAGQVFASCHCYNWSFHGTNSFPRPTGYSRVDPVNGIGWYDPVTLEHRAVFHPASMRSGPAQDGVWSMDGDADGCLWFGGDVVRGSYSGDAATDWLGNFGRFCPEDRTVPTAPGAPVVDVAPMGGATDTVTLRWSPSSDPVGPLEYWVYRDGRVVGTTTGTTWTDTGRTGAAAYVVRAVDAAGNRSATAPPTVAAPVGEPLVPAGSEWRWSYPTTDPPAGWATDPSAVDGWAAGRGELGFGEGDEATVVAAAPAPRPVTAYFRRTVAVADPAAWSGFVVDVVRDDGVLVRVNGTEVCRDNLPPGPLTGATGALVAVSARSEETTPVRCEVPAGVVRAGDNVVAVEVHNTDRWSSDLSFDLRFGGRR